MTWLRYACNDYQPDVNIRLEDVVGVTVGRISGVIWGVEVYYSDGQKIAVGTFSPIEDTNEAPHLNDGREMARERAEEIKLAVDKAKA